MSGDWSTIAETTPFTNYSNNNMLADKADFTIHSCSVQLLDDSSYRIYIDYTMPAGMSIFIYLLVKYLEP